MTGEACVANIGRKQRRIRLGFGVFMSLVTVASFLAFLVLPLPRWVSLGIFIPAFLAATGILQHTEST